jgi:hypothetical protein
MLIHKVDDRGNIRYELNGLLHRANGPAVEWVNGSWAWYLKGVGHRYYGPAWSNDRWNIRGGHVKGDGRWNVTHIGLV